MFNPGRPAPAVVIRLTSLIKLVYWLHAGGRSLLSSHFFSQTLLQQATSSASARHCGDEGLGFWISTREKYGRRRESNRFLPAWISHSCQISEKQNVSSKMSIPEYHHWVTIEDARHIKATGL
jgi:hypothetical protein